MKIWGQGFLVGENHKQRPWDRNELVILEVQRSSAGAREWRVVMRSDVREGGKRPGHEVL